MEGRFSARFIIASVSLKTKNVECVADLKLDITEQIDVVLLPIDKLFEAIDRGILLQTLHISSLFFALKKLGKVQFY